MKISRGRYLIVLLLCPLISFSQFLEYSNEFLNIGAGARGIAMGNAQVASVSDATAGYWNPAGLTNIKDNPNAAIMHAEYFSGIGKYDYGSFAIPIQNNTKTLAFTFLRFAVDDIPNTLYLVQPDGSVNYNNIQSFSSADYAFLVSYAQHLKKFNFNDISFGFNAKIIRQVVGSFANSWGFGFDAGMQMVKDKWQLGLMAKDITTTFNAWSYTFSTQEQQALFLAGNDIPTKSTELTAPSLALGTGYNFKIGKAFNILAELDANLTFGYIQNSVIRSKIVNASPNLGLEASIDKKFFIRAGVTNFQQALADGDTLNQRKVWIFQPSIGAGIVLKDATIDYAYSELANQTSPLFTNVFSLKVNLVKKEKRVVTNKK